MSVPAAPPARSSKTTTKNAKPSNGFRTPTVSNAGAAILVNGVGGVGKTTLGAYADGSVFILAPQETGYLTLFDHGRVPERPYCIAESWEDLLKRCDEIIAEPGDIKQINLDALGGFEHLCHEHVCLTHFNGVWGEKGFLSYHKGFEMSVNHWLKFLRKLEQIKQHGINILLLGHSKVKPHTNPLGHDYSRYVCDCHEKTWGVTHKWADAVIFYTFEQNVEKVDGKYKGRGKNHRVMFTERTDAYDAKNRFGLPEIIDIDDENPAAAHSTLKNLIKKG